MLRTVVLHGDLAERFGRSFRLDIHTPREAGRALGSQLKGFESFVTAPRAGVLPRYRVVVGPLEKGDDRTEDELDLALGKSEELHIVPVLAGAGGRGMAIMKIVLGVALMAVGVGFGIGAGFGAYAIGSSTSMIGITFGQLAFTGLTMLLRGVSGLLAPQPKSNYSDRENQKASFLFNGSINVAEQGNVIPVVIGEVITGSIVISAALDTVQF
jgi:predicted phage tail protein